MLRAIQAGNITEIRYYNFQPQWALLYSGSLPNFIHAYDLIEMGFMMVKFGMLSCYSRCCVVLYKLISGIRKIMFSCQTSASTLIHSRSASLIKLRSLMQTPIYMNGLPASRFYEYSSSCLYLILYSEKKNFVKCHKQCYIYLILYSPQKNWQKKLRKATNNTIIGNASK